MYQAIGDAQPVEGVAPVVSPGWVCDGARGMCSHWSGRADLSPTFALRAELFQEALEEALNVRSSRSKWNLFVNSVYAVPVAH